MCFDVTNFKLRCMPSVKLVCGLLIMECVLLEFETDPVWCVMLGYHMPSRSFSLQRPFVAAAIGGTTSVPSDCIREHSSFPVQADNMDAHEEFTEQDRGSRDAEPGPECLNDNRMNRVCEKLIEVFMVDKPTTTDWRRLLAFSREWTNIRPHFFQRCQERADAEHDPGMKHKLLRLGRKLKEVLVMNLC